MDTNIQYEETFSRKFKSIIRELDLLEAKIYKTKGFLFPTHVYTTEELLKSEHHQRIYSWVEKIGSDVMSWDQNGRLNKLERDSYNKHRDKVEERLDTINQNLINREPTWWETVRDAFMGFTRIISQLLPKLISKLLGGGPGPPLLPP